MTLPLTHCPLTKIKLIKPVEGASTRNTYHIQLPSFEYEIKTTLLEDADSVKDLSTVAHRLAGLARDMYEESDHQDHLKIMNDFEALLEDPRIPSDDDISRKAQKVLTALKVRTGHFGEKVVLNLKTEFPIAYARNDEEFQSITTFLLDQGYVEHYEDTLTFHEYAPENASPRSTWVLSLTSRAFSLLNSGPSSRQIFIAVRFDDPAHDPFIEAIKKGVDDAGFEPICLKKKESEFPDRIMDKALGDIGQSKYIVVDLSGNRSSVSFEAGYALALGKELIFVAPEKEKGHREFYSGHYKISFYSDEEELRGIVRDSIHARERRSS